MINNKHVSELLEKIARKNYRALAIYRMNCNAEKKTRLEAAYKLLQRSI